jgi:hypothetical protein
MIQFPVQGRGIPPFQFLQELLSWGKSAPQDIFAPNANPRDIYATVHAVLGPYENPLHRRAVMLEVMRVHAGFESSWNWNEGVDITNRRSLAHIEGQETGIFQVSFDSTFLKDPASGESMKPFAEQHDIATAREFIPAMKQDHLLAMEYYSRLVRISVAWAGPIKRHEIDASLKRESVQQFMELLLQHESSG